MTMTDSVQNLRDAAPDFAKFLTAFIECSPAIQHIVVEQSEIIRNPNATQDEKSLATDAMIEALLPGLTADLDSVHRELLLSPDVIAADEEIAREELAFASAVREKMQSLGMTQEALANAIGVGQPAVSNILNRQCRPQRKTVRKIAIALGVSPRALWPGIDD